MSPVASNAIQVKDKNGICTQLLKYSLLLAVFAVRAISIRDFQNQSNYSGQSQLSQTVQLTNQNSKQIHVKRGKTPATDKPRFVWILLLIGRESGASFANQSQSKLLSTQLQTAL